MSSHFQRFIFSFIMSRIKSMSIVSILSKPAVSTSFLFRRNKADSSFLFLLIFQKILQKKALFLQIDNFFMIGEKVLHRLCLFLNRCHLAYCFFFFMDWSFDSQPRFDAKLYVENHFLFRLFQNFLNRLFDTLFLLR